MNRAERAKKLLHDCWHDPLGGDSRNTDAFVDAVIAASLEAMREELQGRANAPEATDGTGTPEASVGGDEAGVEATEGTSEVSPAVKKALSTYQHGRELVEENERLRADLKRTLADHETACEKMRSAMAALMVRLAEAMSLPPDDNLRDSYPLLVGKVCEHIKRLEGGAYRRMEDDQFGILARQRLAHAVGIPEGEVGQYSTMKLVELAIAKMEVPRA